MKKLKFYRVYLITLVVALFAASCNDDGIDPISRVDPGPDAASPVVLVKYPVEGTKIQVPEDITSIDISFEVTDDIEIKDIMVYLDNNLLATYNNFVDYRRFIEDGFTYSLITNGDHVLKVVATDLVGNETNASVNFEKVAPYQPQFDGEIFYMPFDNSFQELISLTDADVIGNPTFAGESVLTGSGLNAYKGAVDSYLSIPLSSFMTSSQSEFSATFWMKVNGDPTRAGVLTIGPPDAANPTSANNRTSGFRFFREGGSTSQRFKLNVGGGSGDSWFDGGSAADVVPDTDEWVHFAFTISPTECVVYINGSPVKQGSFSGVSWANCTQLSIMSGAPNFIGWSHYSDLSIMDELRIFNKALTAAEVNTVLDATRD